MHTTNLKQPETITINGSNLSLEQVWDVARGISEDGKPLYAKVKIDDDAANKLLEVRSYIEENWLKENAPPIYGFNTGVGSLKDYNIGTAENNQFQKQIIESHCAGIGEPAEQDVIRATMLIRANALLKGVSGIRLIVVTRLIDMLNAGVHPVIPQQGSVGASGDLAPLAHLVSALVGHPEAEAYFKNERMSAQDALTAAGITPVEFQMQAKDVLAMINGCTFTMGFACLAMKDAEALYENASIACALSMEAMRGEMAAFDDRIQQARNHPGQIQSAEKIRELLEGSQWVTEDARRIALPDEDRQGEYKSRIQDAYSLRCVPQVHGAALDTFTFVRQTLEREMNAATDNPLIFPIEEGQYEMLSGGNFHGEHLAFAMDFLKIAVHEIGNISERRSARFLDSKLSYGLPFNLVGSEVGLNTGFTLAQCAASSIVSENKALCFPLSADSIPTKANQEDHVSNSTAAARKAQEVTANARKIIAIELLCACQAISIAEKTLNELDRGPKTKLVYEAVRKEIPPMVEDRYVHRQMKTAQAFVDTNSLVDLLAGHKY